MGFFDKFIEIVHKFSGNNIGYLFNNTVYNSSTSTIGFVFTGKNCIKSVLKGIASPLPWCKGLYFTSATLSGVSCVLSSSCLLSGWSCLGPYNLFIAGTGYLTSLGARGCNTLGDCMNPAASLSNTAVERCIDLITENWS